MKVLIAGSEGSLMQWVIPHLLETGHEVIGVDNFSRYGEIERVRPYEFLKGDLCDKRVAHKACHRVDAVIQAAARIYGVSGFHTYAADILSKDMELHQNLLWEALDRGVQRFIYISSSMVYERSERHPVCEEDLEDMKVPKTGYGLSKLIGERLCQAFHSQYGMAYTVWRPFNIITPYEKAEPEPGMSHVFADFIRKIIIEKQNPMTILGDGQQVRCFTWIDDVAYAIARYSFDEKTACEAINLGNPEPVTIKQLAEMIFAKAQKAMLISDSNTLKFTHSPTYDDDVRVRIPAIEKAKRLLGWKPTATLSEALDRCLAFVAAEL